MKEWISILSVLSILCCLKAKLFVLKQIWRHSAALAALASAKAAAEQQAELHVCTKVISQLIFLNYARTGKWGICC